MQAIQISIFLSLEGSCISISFMRVKIILTNVADGCFLGKRNTTAVFSVILLFYLGVGLNLFALICLPFVSRKH